MVALGAVNVPDVSVNVLPINNVVKLPKLAVVAVVVKPLVVPVRPVNPERRYPELMLKVPVVIVIVPVPLRVPARVIPLGIVGLVPNGSEQLESTVLTPV